MSSPIIHANQAMEWMKDHERQLVIKDREAKCNEILRSEIKSGNVGCWQSLNQFPQLRWCPLRHHSAASTQSHDQSPAIAAVPTRMMTIIICCLLPPSLSCQ